MVFTTRLAGGRGGRNGFETELGRLGITQKNSRPNHPTTCGKVERFQQTLKTWLHAQPDQPDHIDRPPALSTVRRHLQQPTPAPLTPWPSHPRRRLHRPPQSHPRHRTGTHYRVRHDRVDKTGRVTIRYARPPPPHRPRRRAHARTRVVMLIADRHVRVIDAATGELLRHLTLDPTRDYQPPRPPTRTTTPKTATPEPR